MRTTLLSASLICLTSAFAQTPGNALNFDGLNDRVSAPLPAPFSSISNNDFSMEVWFNPLGNSFSRLIFAQNSSSNFANISVASDNTIYFYVVSNNQGFSVQTDTALVSGTWTHIAATWDAVSNDLQVYFNGIAQPTTGGGSSTDAGSNTLSLGSRPDGFQFLNGEMDDIRIWDHVRTNCDIRSYMNTVLTGNEPGLVAHYQCNEGSAGMSNTGVTNLPDLTSNMNDGTLNGFNLNGAVSNWVSSGAVLNQNTPTQFVDVGITNMGTSLMSDQAGASYQWLDCDIGFQTIIGATQQSFTPVQSGNYAVQVTFDGCTDTSACEAVVVSSVNELENEEGVSIQRIDEETFQLSLHGIPGNAQAEIYDVAGKLVSDFPVRDRQTVFRISNGSTGIHILMLRTGEVVEPIRFMVN